MKIRRLPKSLSPVVFAFYMSAFMAALMTTVLVTLNTGFDNGLGWRIAKSYVIAMPIAFICALLVRPLVNALLKITIQQD